MFFSYSSSNIIAVKSHTTQNPSQINEVTEDHQKKPLYIPQKNTKTFRYNKAQEIFFLIL